MKYLNKAKQAFPNQSCSVRFSDDLMRGLEVVIQVGDYYMASRFSPHELANSRLDEKYIDCEFEYMFEAMKGKFENDKAQEDRCRREFFRGGRFA